mmetsp:Transcript_49288/g.60541  ORF Transcript_49288/g.60541 Transcript_49288/m.60541 type:complete len:105 (-) Transcript_49288:821-1135(-)
MSGFRFFLWSLSKGDMAMFTVLSCGVIGGLYTFTNLTSQHVDLSQTGNKKEIEPDKPGRFSGSFPQSSQEYKKVSSKSMTLEEIEWQIKDRERLYNESTKKYGK